MQIGELSDPGRLRSRRIPPSGRRGRGPGLERGRNPRGWKADVRYVPISENRSHGATLRARLRVWRSAGAAVARNGHSADPASTRTATSAATALTCIVWETCSMTSQASPYSRFQRALRTGNLNIIRAAAAELPRVNLEDALSVCMAIRDAEPERFEVRRCPGWRDSPPSRRRPWPTCGKPREPWSPCAATPTAPWTC